MICLLSRRHANRVGILNRASGIAPTRRVDAIVIGEENPV
jgi:hypothetical protein